MQDAAGTPDSATFIRIFAHQTAHPFTREPRMSADLLINALIAGILLGGFYAAVTVGISISFGILDIVNIAHPAFIILGS